MTGVFDDKVIGWHDKTYTISADRVLGAVARIEHYITLHEILQYSERGTAPMAVLAQAYGAVLRYAGAQVTDGEVYEGMFTDGDTTVIVSQLLNGLLGMMLPPSQRDDAKVNNSGNSRKAGKRSSRKSTKRS